MGTQTDLTTLVELVADGEFSPRVDATRDAFAAMQNREGVGKLVVTP